MLHLLVTPLLPGVQGRRREQSVGSVMIPTGLMLGLLFSHVHAR